MTNDFMEKLLTDVVFVDEYACYRNSKLERNVKLALKEVEYECTAISLNAAGELMRTLHQSEPGNVS